MIRYFEVRAPRADFNGTIAGAQFLDGRTRVSYEDDHRTAGTTGSSQPGYSLVQYARGRSADGYTVVELDSLHGHALPEAGTR